MNIRDHQCTAAFFGGAFRCGEPDARPGCCGNQHGFALEQTVTFNVLGNSAHMPSPQLPQTFCAGTASLISLCTTSPSSDGSQRSPLSTPSVVRQPSQMQMRPPSDSNTLPVTSPASSEASQASSVETFSGAQ